MKKKILITAGAIDVGGVERSLIGLLSAFDYEKYDVDLFLFSQKGEFFDLLPSKCRLLPEDKRPASLYKSTRELIREKDFLAVLPRLAAKAYIALNVGVKKRERHKQGGASLQQAYWDFSIKPIKALEKDYDAALSFIWPHHFVAKKVKAKVKLAWVHTDYNIVAIDKKRDEAIWQHFDKIAVVSDECGKIFKGVYPSLASKVLTIENVLSKDHIINQADAFDPTQMQKEKGYKLLSVGRFCYQKAFGFSVEVCEKLCESYPDLRWYLIGYGDEEEKIKEKIKALAMEENFIVLGKKKNPYPYMKACDIYIQASRNEGKSVAIREAQILGKPVLISDYETAGDQVRDGFDGIISKMDLESLTFDIRNLIEDKALRQELTKNTLLSDYENLNALEIIYNLVDKAVAQE